MESSSPLQPPKASLSYLRVVQQLQKKTEELERVFDEARRLERETATLAEQNAALKKEKAGLERNVEALEAQSREWRAEFAALEAQVKEQQWHLQEYIEKEAKRLQEHAEKTRENDAWRMESVRAVQEKAKIAVECDKLSCEVAELKKELKAAKSKATHYRSSHARAAMERTVMEEIENKALEGVRSEITSFAAENERLISEVSTERKARLAAEESVANLKQLLQRQREVSERHQLLAKQELQALNMQNDALLEDIKHLMERDAKSRSDSERRRETFDNRRRPVTVDCGTMTTDVPYAPLLTASPKRAEATKLEQGLCETALLESVSNTAAQKKVNELKEEMQNLHRTIAEQALMLREKEAKERVFEQRSALFEEERQHLRSLVAKSSVTLLEKSTKTSDSSHIVRAEADTELSAVLEAVVNVLRCFVQCVNNLRVCFSLPSTTTDTTVLPIVPCHDYSSPHLNAIFSHIEGLRNIALVIEKIGEKAAATHIKKQTKDESPQPKQQTAHKNTPPKKQNLNTERNSPNNSHTTKITTRNISTWLEERKNNLKRQFQECSTIQQTASQQKDNVSTTHTPGETLKEATNELHQHLYRK